MVGTHQGNATWCSMKLTQQDVNSMEYRERGSELAGITLTSQHTGEPWCQKLQYCLISAITHNRVFFSYFKEFNWISLLLFTIQVLKHKRQLEFEIKTNHFESMVILVVKRKGKYVVSWLQDSSYINS